MKSARSIFFKFLVLAVCATAIAVIPTFSKKSRAEAADSKLPDAWSAWHNGEIKDAERLAATGPDTDEARHLLLLCAFVNGRYEEALKLYQKIDKSYPRYDELNSAAAMAYLHLGLYEEAGRFSRTHKIHDSAGDFDDINKDMIEVMAEHPLKVSLDKITIIPFAKDISAEYFPPFEAEINGKKIVAHLDTGGAFLYMGPKRARKLGIKPLKCTPIFANTGRGYKSQYDLCTGIAKSFRLGDACFENVPVATIPTLDLGVNYAIFGTSVLEQFLSTMDYPNKRLILSPRNDPALRSKHLQMLPEKRAKLPFYLWGTHFMFARGGVGSDKNLNLFIDSGFVDFRWDSKLRRRQAAFIAPRKNFLKWGNLPESTGKKNFEAAISLGPLTQDDCIITLERPRLKLSLDFGGVRIDGVLSHAFLKNYSWTLDFDEHRYIFDNIE